MKLSRKMEYALMALRHMNAKDLGVLTSAKEISDIYGSSFDVTSRVMQRLAQAGVLRSIQGAQGGYQMQQDLSTLSFYDLNSLVEGPLGVAKCLHESGNICDLEKVCNIISPMQKLNAKLEQFYKSLPVSELLGQARNSTEVRPKNTPLEGEI